ncbi:MAG: hypothetical protein GY786_15435 [Proteobacteria bacterium]|nr:hypothetical protein [Pseudomonadota bacterium]
MKTIIIFGGGYLVFRIVKASLKNSIANMLKPKEIHEPAELVKCEECQSFVDSENAVHRRKMVFCSSECQKKHFSKDS